VWDSLREQATLEREELRRLLQAYRALLEKCAGSPPTDIELSALAAMLHSFYNGIENIFKRIREEFDEPLPRSEFWHRDLLDCMGKSAKGRPAVISASVLERLEAYLDFRHFFRHSYVIRLRWDRMKDLALGCDETLRLLEDELDQFFVAGTGSPQ